MFPLDDGILLALEVCLHVLYVCV